jgi:integrase/recombinase XerD
VNDLEQKIMDYLFYCEHQKKLNAKSIKAYRIDLMQFFTLLQNEIEPISKVCITSYIQDVHKKYKAKTAKRKIASIRAFLNYLEFDEQIESNPMQKIRVDFREPITLPKALPLETIKKLLSVSHHMMDRTNSQFQYKMMLRNCAILELLFATGLRVSELCSIEHNHIDLTNGFLKIQGKGAKERVVFIGNQETLSVLRLYKKIFSREIDATGFFFINRLGRKLTEQSVRDMISSYAIRAKIPEHITPHMIRHSFATLMLEEDVDIRYIQNILGHSSIVTTQIYTHVSLGKQKSIMKKKHPRNRISI